MSTIQQFNYSVDLLKAILWEYNTAPNLQAILTAKQTWYTTNQTDFWENWFTDVFNLETCNDFGCVVWAIILGIPITYVSQPSTHSNPWGFDATNLTNFDGFSNFTAQQSEPLAFTTQQKQVLLRLRYRQLVARGVIPETNKILSDILGYLGKSYMLDGLDMTQTYVSLFPIPSFLNVILTELDLLPRPASVRLKIRDMSAPYWGFGPANTNFNNGGFIPSIAI